MKKVKLGEVFDLQMGKTPARNEIAYWGGCNKWVSIADLSKTNKYIEETKEFITDKAIKESGIKSVPANTVIMSFKLSIGKTAITKEEIYTNEAIMAFIDKKQYFLDVDYLYHLFSSMDWSEGSNKAVLGLTLNKATLSQKYICIPSLEEQKEIADRLDKVSSLIEKRKTQVQKLDELIKSRFIEMFGDYDLSHTQSDWKTIFEIGKVVGGATPKTNIEEYWDGEYRWITPAELDTNSGYIYDSVRKLTKAGIDSCSLQEMPINTVILSSRAPIGKVAIAGNTFYCNQGFKNIICNGEILPRYLYTILLLNTEYLNSLGRGATFKEISKSIVENIKIPVPPIKSQNQFAVFVEQVDKSKLAIQKSIGKLETLKKSLMQQYFG